MARKLQVRLNDGGDGFEVGYEQDVADATQGNTERLVVLMRRLSSDGKVEMLRRLPDGYTHFYVGQPLKDELRLPKGGAEANRQALEVWFRQQDR